MSHARNIAAILGLVGTVVLVWRLYVVRGELAQAQDALATEKVEHVVTADKLTEGASELLDSEERLKELGDICEEGAAASMRRQEMLFRCEEKICGNRWVPYDRHSLCLNALWDVDPAAGERLEMEELDAARKQNEKDAQRAAEGISFVTVDLYDRCVGLLHTCDEHGVVGSRSLVDELLKLEEQR